MGVPPYGGGYNMEWHGPPMHPHAGPFGYGEGMHGPGPGPMPFDRPMMPGPGYGGPPFGMPPMYPGVPHHGYLIQLFINFIFMLYLFCEINFWCIGLRYVRASITYP